MGVVVVQSRATALVYRVFAALVALLVVMAVVVTVSRLRPDRPAGSPYGGLAAVTPVTPAPAPAVRLAKAADPDASLPPAAPAVAAASAAPLVQASDPVPPADPAPKGEPRRIALDKLAAGSSVPQPAPPARVEAAARAALAPPPAPPAAAPAPAPGPAPQAVASLAPAAPATDPGVRKPPGGGVNINTASEQQLDGLGGGRIGRWIVRHRPYRSISDLVDHRVLKARDFARIRSAITVD